jgi:hypothetical protein
MPSLLRLNRLWVLRQAPGIEEGENMMSREVCKRCGKESGVGFSVPDFVWGLVSRNRWNILCIGCFSELADALRIEWDMDIEFYPVSLVTAIKQEGYPAGPPGDNAHAKIAELHKEIEHKDALLREHQYDCISNMGFDHADTFHCIGCGAEKGSPCEPHCWMAEELARELNQRAEDDALSFENSRQIILKQEESLEATLACLERIRTHEHRNIFKSPLPKKPFPGDYWDKYDLMAQHAAGHKCCASIVTEFFTEHPELRKERK